MTSLTPAMRQYLEIKEKHKDCILFFRMGDFYEMFFEDAVVASKVLEIDLPPYFVPHLELEFRY